LEQTRGLVLSKEEEETLSRPAVLYFYFVLLFDVLPSAKVNYKTINKSIMKLGMEAVLRHTDKGAPWYISSWLVTFI
jgi:hypothetical protein